MTYRLTLFEVWLRSQTAGKGVSADRQVKDSRIGVAKPYLI